jgi:hypothetical protein
MKRKEEKNKQSIEVRSVEDSRRSRGIPGEIMQDSG